MEKVAASYEFNQTDDISSSATGLYNQRLAILFFTLDMDSVELNSTYSVDKLYKVRALNLQIYKNIRSLVRNNPLLRAYLHLDTKDSGINVIDIMLNHINNLVSYCENNGWTKQRVYIVAQELNDFEQAVKDILQYYNYFVRPNFKQKPEVSVATEKYKALADALTIEQLKSVAGKNNRIDFESLGTAQVSLDSDEVDDTGEIEETEVKQEIEEV
jgi:hypothetical protein